MDINEAYMYTESLGLFRIGAGEFGDQVLERLRAQQDMLTHGPGGQSVVARQHRSDTPAVPFQRTFNPAGLEEMLARIRPEACPQIRYLLGQIAILCAGVERL